MTLSLTNVIAQGGPGGDSICVGSDGLGGEATLTATHSNFANCAKYGFDIECVDGWRQPACCAHVRQCRRGRLPPGRGVGDDRRRSRRAAQRGFDVEGDPRRIGPTDIGADEFVPAPTVVTGPATGIGAQSATLIGSVTANAVPTSYHFEYGPTTAYGSATTATDPGAGLGALPVAATLDGLSPGRHITSGSWPPTRPASAEDTTRASPPRLHRPPRLQLDTAGFAGVRLVSTRLTLSGRFITLKLSCPAGDGRWLLGPDEPQRAGAPSSGAARRVILGRARFSIAAGDQAKVRVRVSRAGQRRLKGVRRLRGRDTNAAHDGAGVVEDDCGHRDGSPAPGREGVVMKAWIAAAASAACLTLVLPAVAGAADYCVVPNVGCGGTNVVDLQRRSRRRRPTRRRPHLSRRIRPTPRRPWAGSTTASRARRSRSSGRGQGRPSSRARAAATSVLRLFGGGELGSRPQDPDAGQRCVRCQRTVDR